MIYLEKTAKRRSKGGILPAVLVPLISGTTAFLLCLLLFPVILLKTDDPTTFIPVAACVSVVVPSFFASLALSRITTVHFAAAGFIIALAVSILLTVAGLIFGDITEIGFTAISCIMSVVFSLLGAKIGKPGNKKRKRR